MQRNPEARCVSSYTTRDEGEEDNLTSGSLTNERGVNMQYCSRVLGTFHFPISRVISTANAAEGNAPDYCCLRHFWERKKRKRSLPVQPRALINWTRSAIARAISWLLVIRETARDQPKVIDDPERNDKVSRTRVHVVSGMKARLAGQSASRVICCRSTRLVSDWILEQSRPPVVCIRRKKPQGRQDQCDDASRRGIANDRKKSSNS